MASETVAWQPRIASLEIEEYKQKYLQQHTVLMVKVI